MKGTNTFLIICVHDQKHKMGDVMKKIFLNFILITCISVATVSSYFLINRYFEDCELNKTYDIIRFDARKGNKIDWKKLKKQNPDIIGWIQVKDTNIDYPVVKGKNNDQYLHTDFYGKNRYGGCIFMDSKCDLSSSDNILIYGHHMRNGSMFADLLKFKKQSFASNHIIYFYTPKKTYRLKAFSSYAKYEESEIPIKFGSQKSKASYMHKIERRSMITGKEPLKDQKIFTFVTCSYESNNYRTYVHAVLQ